MTPRLAVLALATAALAACEPNPSVTGPAAALQAARAADVSAAVSDPGAVYTLTNQVGGNAVAVFARGADGDRKSTRLNSSHSQISYAVFCLKKKQIRVLVKRENSAC